MVKVKVIWRTLRDPEYGEIDTTTAQYHRIRRYAFIKGYKGLRGLHWALKRGDDNIYNYWEALRATYL